MAMRDVSVIHREMDMLRQAKEKETSLSKGRLFSGRLCVMLDRPNTRVARSL